MLILLTGSEFSQCFVEMVRLISLNKLVCFPALLCNHGMAFETHKLNRLYAKRMVVRYADFRLKMHTKSPS